MSLKYPPIPYPTMSSPSTVSSTILLLTPMPIPCTPSAPYFDRSRVRDFLERILLHRANAGVMDTDSLVPYIVRYSSDRVRASIQYIPELDPDEPNKTWSEAVTAMLNLYEYLRQFITIAAPLVKQCELTESQRDFYFVADIPSCMKEHFIYRVPEHQPFASAPTWIEPETELDNTPEPASNTTVCADEKFKVSPSDDELVEDTVEFTHREHDPIEYQHKITDHVPEPSRVLEQDITSGVSMHADTEPTDPRAISGEIDGDCERYLAGDYDSIELSSFDSSEVSDSCDTTGSDCASIFDSVTDFEADFLLSSRSEPYALSYSLSYAISDAAFDPDRDSLEHTDVQQSDKSESDLPATCDVYSFVEHTQLSIPPPITCFDPCSEPDSGTDLFLELFYNEENAYNLSALFPNDEPDLDTIYESPDIPELSCFSFDTDQKSSEVSAVSINHDQNAQVDSQLYFTQETDELSYIPSFDHFSQHSEPEPFTDPFLESFSTEQKCSEPSTAHTSDEQDTEFIYDLYFRAHRPKLSHQFTFIPSTSDSEPASITDTFIELILSQETSRRVDSETKASTRARDSSFSTHANFDEDLCTSFEVYTEQHEHSSQAEPSKRAESQPFSLRTSYVHDFVPELLQSRTESHAHARIKPTDNPPSYQELILASEPSFTYRWCASAILRAIGNNIAGRRRMGRVRVVIRDREKPWEKGGAANYAGARALYLAARVLAPHKGNAAHQLAILAGGILCPLSFAFTHMRTHLHSYKSDPLASVAWYLHALWAASCGEGHRDEGDWAAELEGDLEERERELPRVRIKRFKWDGSESEQAPWLFRWCSAAREKLFLYMAKAAAVRPLT
ncbi:hypothetical protein DFH09DRAFT_1088578 [Mycena vulgaris]|nr:hypothetical protein DFH09DRAFT_1088578 [Mycena vulgaris]